MKRLYYVLIAAAICVLSIHCQREVVIFRYDDNNSTISPSPPPYGNVVDQNGQPLPAVATIKVGNKIATTDSKGFLPHR